MCRDLGHVIILAPLMFAFLFAEPLVLIEVYVTLSASESFEWPFYVNFSLF